MASYVNLTLDTICPAGVSVKINGDDAKTASTAVTLSITCGDADLTGYQMKIWGTASAENEASATWETYQNTKNVTLPAGDGIKTVYVKVRDDVWNESTAVSDTVTLYEKVPTVLGLQLYNSRISLVDGKNSIIGCFGFDEWLSAVKIMLVQNINAAHDDPTNISIPRANGSYMESDNGPIENISDVLEASETMVDSAHIITFTLTGADIVSISPGDGAKIVKVFVRSAESGNWSV